MFSTVRTTLPSIRNLWIGRHMSMTLKQTLVIARQNTNRDAVEDMTQLRRNLHTIGIQKSLVDTLEVEHTNIASDPLFYLIVTRILTESEVSANRRYICDNPLKDRRTAKISLHVLRHRFANSSSEY